MSIVTLTSGGLDSTVMALLAKNERVEQFPLFIDYGQINRDREYSACRQNLERLGLPTPDVADISGLGKLISSGLTDPGKRIYEDAFLPCRNLIFLTIGAAYAHQRGASAVAIGLLDESRSLFPDQTLTFIEKAEAVLRHSLEGIPKILTPLIEFSKGDVVKIAKSLGVTDTYSCHAGTAEPCGRCIACREYIGTEA